MKQRIKNAVCPIMVFIFHWVTLCNFSLGRPYISSDSITGVIEIRIDPVAAEGGVDMELFDSIVYIPLETNRASEFSTITQLEVTKDDFIILDRTLNTLFFFNRDGSFSHKIDKNNESVPFKQLRQFAVDRSRDILTFQDSWTPYNYTFGLDGEFIEVVERKLAPKDFALFNGFKVYYHPSFLGNRDDSTHFAGIVRYDAETDQHLGSYLPIESVRKNRDLLGVTRYFYQSDGGRLFFTQPYDYTIYEFDSFAVPHARYKIVLPLANTVPADFLTNSIYQGKWRDYLSANRSLIYSIEDVYVSGDWLTFYTAPSIQGSAFLYNLATFELFNLKETLDSSVGVPVTGNLKPVLGMYDKALISELPFVTLKKLYDNTSRSEQRDMFPPHINELMKKETYNPILRLSYFKQNY